MFSLLVLSGNRLLLRFHCFLLFERPFCPGHQNREVIFAGSLAKTVFRIGN